MDKKYLSKLTFGSTTYDLKDAEARQSISDIQTAITGGMHYVGETSTELSDGATTSTLVAKSANSLSKTTGFEAGDIVIYGELEFIWNGAKWSEFGSTGSLKALAFKDNASATHTPAGTNAASAVSFSGQTDGDFVTGYNDDAVAPSFSEGAFDEGTLPSFTEGAFTQGTLPSFTEGAFSQGTLPSLGEATTSAFATEGVTATVDETNEVITFAAASTSNAVTAQGTFSAGTLPTKAADTWSAGTLPTKAADTFSAGTLPSKAADSFSAGSAATLATSKAITAVGTGTAAAQTFTGTQATITVS